MDTKIPKFRRCVIQNFPFIEADFDALTDYGLVSKIVEYLNTVINQTNTTTENMQALQAAFNTLKDYVDHYFDNLDVQEEINNKLDEMVESGELAEIIGSYLNFVSTFDTEADLTACEYLLVGQKVRTLGKETINDGTGYTFIITDSEPSALDNEQYNNATDNYYLSLPNNLYAVRITDTENDYYKEITVEREIYNDTTCYITTIPTVDSNDNPIDIYIKRNKSMDISAYARKHKTTITTNASLTILDTSDDTYKDASVISDGEIINNNDEIVEGLDDHYCFVAIKSNREFTSFQANQTTAEAMIAQGVKQAWLCFGKIVDNGVATAYATDTSDSVMGNYYPRQAIGVKLDGTVIIFTCDGRTTLDKGLTGTELATKLISMGVSNAWNLDGGGSVNTLYKGTRINKFIDGTGMQDGTVERRLGYCLNVKKPTSNENIDDVISFIGEIKDDVIKELIPQINRMRLKNPANLNELTTGNVLYTTYNSTNYPSGASPRGYLIVLPIASENNQYFGKYCRQYYIDRDTGRTYVRDLVNEVWGSWTRLNCLTAGEITGSLNQTMGANSYKRYVLSTVSTNFPTNVSVNTDGDFTISKAGGIVFNATFVVLAGADGLCHIRLSKNGNPVVISDFDVEEGKTYTISFNKILSCATTDVFTIQSNGGASGSSNTIVKGYIDILENNE